MRTPSLHFNFSLLLVVKHYGACIIYNRLVRFEYQESHKYSADLISAKAFWMLVSFRLSLI